MTKKEFIKQFGQDLYNKVNKLVKEWKAKSVEVEEDKKCRTPVNVDMKEDY